MTEKTRIPLPTDLATRDATVSHDGLLQNLYEENTPIGPMIVKRPGLTNNIALGPCVAQGSTFFNSNNYYICSNVLYVNPATSMPITTVCPVPITFGSGGWAVTDPVTGYIWTGDAGNGVRVYNAATQALIQTIPNPAGASSAAGITYNSTTRRMIVANNTPLDTVSAWAINADTYAVTNTISAGGGSGYTPDAPIHIPLTATMALYSNNFGGNYSFNDTNFSGLSAANPFPVFGAFFDFLYIPTQQMWAFSTGSAIVITVSTFNGATGTNYSYPIAAGTAASPMCWDSKRQYIWVADISNNKLYFINIVNGVPQVLTTAMTLPYSTSVRMCYDQYRDSLWIVSDNNAGTVKHLLRIDPTNLVVLNDCTGVDSFFSSTNNNGRLLMLDSHHMLNCTGRSSSSISLQYLAI